MLGTVTVGMIIRVLDQVFARFGPWPSSRKQAAFALAIVLGKGREPNETEWQVMEDGAS